ncbi:MAG: DUF962 domain-containing protein [Deltaproteobacteria bacterium]|nr:MAG: DUF962 domain-containing protein [Deltaproteobacteria bacterium]
MLKRALMTRVADLTQRFGDEKQRAGALTIGGMAALAAGLKGPGLAMFARGARELEARWRADHGFTGGLAERWERAVAFYDAQHRDPTNRALHMIGIPMIVGGAVGLVASPRFTPPWAASVALFGAGWALNILGHARYEKNDPAFLDDPLSFIAGPVWDVKNLVSGRRPATGAA